MELGVVFPKLRKNSKKDKIKLRNSNENTHFAKLKAPGLTKNLEEDNKEKLEELNSIIGQAPFVSEFLGEIRSLSRNSDKVTIVMKKYKKEY